MNSFLEKDTSDERARGRFTTPACEETADTSILLPQSRTIKQGMNLNHL